MISESISKLPLSTISKSYNPLKYVQTFRISIFHSANGLIMYQSIVEAETRLTPSLELSSHVSRSNVEKCIRIAAKKQVPRRSSKFPEFGGARTSSRVGWRGENRWSGEHRMNQANDRIICRRLTRVSRHIPFFYFDTERRNSNE